MNASIHRCVRAGALAAVFFLGAAGAAQAAGVVHACANKNNGAVRVIDADAGQTCAKNENPIEWSQGLEVWHGESNFVPSVQHNTATFLTDWTLTTLASVSLPAGSFLIDAKTSLLEQDEAATFYCTLGAAGIGDWSWSFAPTDEPTTMALQAVVTLASPGVVALKCGSTGPNSSADQSKVDAIKAGIVH